jgi:hypothetical protein
MAACFTEDGTWQTFYGKATGRQAIAEFAAGLRAHRPGQSSSGAPRTIHHVTNVGPKIGSGGAYDDDMVRVDGRWYFRHRTIDRYIRPEQE